MFPKKGIRKELITIGLLLTLLLAGFVWLLTKKVSTHDDRLNALIAKNIAQQKVLVYKNEFSTILQEFEKLKQEIHRMAEEQPQLFTNHPQAPDALQRAIQGLLQHRSKIEQYWVDRPPIGDRPQWVLRDTIMIHHTPFYWGLNFNFQALQQQFWKIDQLGSAYGFLVDSSGQYLMHPDETLLGTQIPAIQNSHNSQMVQSDFLNVEVMRTYYPFLNQGWQLVIDTPAFVFKDQIASIKHYIILLSLIVILLILVFFIYSGLRVNHENKLRVQAEISKQMHQKQNALLQLEKLKDKLNPHFLFNSLGSLNALIDQKPELAQQFVVKLSQVYRYVLEEFPNGLASIEEELRFVEQYFFLLKIRFGEALKPLEITVDKQVLNAKIPFMSIQGAVENAIKHNVVSKSHPLHIQIIQKPNTLVIINNLQLKKEKPLSSNQGITYLESIYQELSTEAFTHGIENCEYHCNLPIIFNPIK